MTPSPPSVLGARVRQVRMQAGISALELDRLARITPGHTSHIEAFRRSRLRADTLARIAIVLGTTSEWFLSGQGRAPTAKDIAAAIERARQRAAEGTAGAQRRQRHLGTEPAGKRCAP